MGSSLAVIAFPVAVGTGQTGYVQPREHVGDIADDCP